MHHRVLPLLIAAIASAPAGLAAAQPAPPIAYVSGQGITATSADGRSSLSISPRIALRHTSHFGGSAPFDLDSWRTESQVRTARLWLRGKQAAADGTPMLTWGMQLAMGAKEFDADTPTPLFDAFVRFTVTQSVFLQVGQWFVPFDRARTVRESGLQLVDRPLPVRELTLDRDAGAALGSDDLLGLGGRLLGRLGVFGGEGRNRFAANGLAKGPLAMGRLEFRPLGDFDVEFEGDLERSATPKLAVGLAGAYAWSALRSRGTTGSEFSAGATADYQWWAADLVARWGGASVLLEAVERRQAGASAAKERSSGLGMLAQGGYMLTERLEVVGRWSRLWPHAGEGQALAASPLHAQAGHEVGGGVNWYLAGHKRKVQLDGQHSWNVGDGTGLGGRQGKQVIRLGLDVTF